ncbi:MAG: glycosyltransferase family 4 protein [bacterium]|nr:glycosyltransferase family 4 protein [bacterium]
MRIGLDITKVLPPRDGIGNFTFQLLRALMDLETGDEFLLYGLPEPADQRAFAAELPDRPASFRLQPAHWPAGGEVDLFHATAWAFPVAFRGPVLATCYDLTFLTHPECHTPANKLHWLTTTLEALLADAGFVAISQSTARELQEQLGVPMERIHVIYPAPAPIFRPLPEDQARRLVRDRFQVETPFLLSVGTLEPRKNHRRLLAAYAQLPAALRARYPLLIAGAEGWKLEALTGDLAQGPELESVRLLGHVADDELVALYSAAAVFVYPSLAEGFGLPVVEAMACGAPVLTSALSALPEVSGDAARLVDPYDVDEIRRAVEELLDAPDERRRLQALGRDRAAAFSWEKTALRTMELYESLLTTR